MLTHLIRRAICPVIGLMLLAGCARGRNEKYPAPPETINVTADANAKALQRALSLQKLANAQPDSRSHRIGANDVIDIKVFEQPKMDLSTRVGGNGTINFPPLGDIEAGGLSERELETAIQNELRGKYVQDPHVSVFTKEIQARMVGIIGAVNQAGQYSSFGRMRLADLISKAGGLKPDAGEVAYVVRYNPAAAENAPEATDTIKVDLDGLLLRGENEWNVALEPSDLVNVPSAGTVHITGNGVRKPGTYALTNKMTLQQIVDLAEGLKYEADRDILLVRVHEGGEKEVFRVNYNELRASRTADIQLRTGDKVIVDRTPIKTALATVGREMVQIFRVLISFNYQPLDTTEE